MSHIQVRGVHIVSKECLAGKLPAHRLVWASRSTIALRKARTPSMCFAENKDTPDVQRQPTADAAPAGSPSLPPSIPRPQNADNTPFTVGAVLGAVLAVVAAKVVGADAPSFETMERVAVPYEVALTNGKPTVMEFYATWCTVCRELLPTELALSKEYSGDINFVVLNIDNTKWSQERVEYAVQGIPHFVFIDETGKSLTAAVGNVPEKVLRGNVEALQRHSPMPFVGAHGEASDLRDAPAGAAKQTSPRDHA